MPEITLTLDTIRAIVVMLLDILIIWFVIYYALRIVGNNTRTIQIFKGILLIVVINALAKLLGLKTLQYIADIFINWGFLAVIIIFQPEIRSVLERMGKSGVFSRITTLTGGEKENLVDNIVTAVMLLSKDQTGALISIEQSRSLDDFIQTGSPMNSDVTAELLVSIFVTSTPLHDGAVIIQGDKIACASAYFPPTTMDLPSRYGARHRAAIGISEISDAVTIIVSEETGEVSIAEAGKLRTVNRKELREYLLRVICGENIEVHSNKDTWKEEEVEEVKEPKKKKSNLADKLTLRKHDTNEKIEVEEVVSGEEAQEAQESQVEPVVVAPIVEPIIDAENTQPTVTQETGSLTTVDLEAKAADMKLPHKKKRKKASYPKQNEERKNKRMTPEEVEAAREANKKRLSHVDSEDEKKFDTSMLDISKVVGFDNELDEQFEMVENLGEDKDTSKKGGEDA